MSCSPPALALHRPPRPRTTRLAAVAALIVLLLSGCGSSPTTQQPTDTAAPAAARAGSTTPGSPGAQSFSMTAVIQRYPTCAAIGAVLGGELDDMKLDETSTADADGIDCRWLPATTAGTRARTKGVSAEPDGGAGDVTDPATLKMIGAEQIQDAGVAASGGIAYLARGTGDLRVDTTTVEVPGVRIAVTEAIVNADPTLTGTVAVTAAKQLLGIS